MKSLPLPTYFRPEESKKLRWGIFGAGWIAEAMISTVQKNSQQDFVAIASRTPGKADAFAQKWNLAAAHTSYEELAAREDIDAIYIATLPSDRVEVALIAINAGKHVLIEKPITMDVSEAETIYAAAKAKKVLAMEAMWTRYLPQTDLPRPLVTHGQLAAAASLASTFCQTTPTLPRLFTLGAGSPIIDMGIYPIALSQQFLGEPTEIHAFGKLNSDQIDEETHVFMRFANQSRSNFILSARTSLPIWAGVSGSKANITFGTPWFTPSSISFQGIGFNAPAITWSDDSGIREHEGLVHQVNAFAQYVANGLLEAPLYTHKESIANIGTALKIGVLINNRFK